MVRRQQPTIPPMTSQELRQFAAIQLEEIDRYKYLLGEKLGRDPLEDRTYNEIACEWIRYYSAEFRKKWGDRYKLPR